MRTGKTLGMGVRDTLARVFANNEKAKKTDPELTGFLMEEFGDDRAYFRNIPNLRAMYNRGALTGGRKPRSRSKRYGPDKRPMRKNARYPAQFRA